MSLIVFYAPFKEEDILLIVWQMWDLEVNPIQRFLHMHAGVTSPLLRMIQILRIENDFHHRTLAYLFSEDFFKGSTTLDRVDAILNALVLLKGQSLANKVYVVTCDTVQKQ